MSSPRNILSDSRDIYGALSGMPGSDSPSLTSNSDSNNNLFDKPIYPDNDETIDNVYDRKEKISSGEKARILDSDHRDGNVVYIVRAIIEDKKDKNLGSGFVMIQESKKKVEKKWYLPAGNVNRNESIEEALVRVVREETGLANGNPEQIISVEEIGPFWFRFTYLVTFTDPGILRHLKTEKDQYSMRAEVWKFEDLIRRQGDLRDEDMLRAIRQYRSFSSSFPNVKSNSAFEKMSDKLSDYESITTKWKKLKVEPIPRDYITVRAVFLFETKDKQPWMLLHKRSKKVPIISCWSALADKCIHTAIFRFINQVHEQDYIHWYSYSTLGITCVENRKTDSPIGGQGLRMTVIFQMRNNNHQLGQKSKGNTANEAREIPPIKQNSDYCWQQMPNCNETINLITTTPNKLPPLLSPRLIKTGHDKEIHLDQWHTNPLFSSTTKK